MNKHLHRIVFNAARGQRMVVQETARSAGKASGATSCIVASTLGAVLMALPSQAQIVGAPNVPGNLRPTVLAAPNGVPLVNIQTSSAAGVSRNVYDRFDVQTNGAILNNSRTSAQTQLGGWVQGNPWLARGPARVILNEVNSGNPTQLRGFVEVAGQRAEVVIANPAGIAVDGGGFINASRATLTTGTPQLNPSGGLDGYVVRSGTVSIDGAGLDARSTDYAAILARAVQVNAGIWANELKVVAGANDISADHGQVSPTTGSGPAPAFSLDVAHLGGMYAGKIMLIGTEAGLGVRNAGAIGAGAGELVVTAAGRLENRGTLEAQSVQLTSAGDIDNRGGTIRQTGAVGLSIAAASLSNTGGGLIGAEPVAQAPAQPGGSAAPSPSIPASPAPSGGTGTGGTDAPPASTPYVPPAPGHITAAGAILNDGGRIYAGGAMALQAPKVDNAGGSLAIASLAVTGPTFSNAGGTLHIAKEFSADVARFDNNGGTLRAGSLRINASGELINQDGVLAGDGDVTLAAGGGLNNIGGTVAGERLSIDTRGQALNNARGALTATQGVDLQTGALTNSAGLIRSGGAMTIDTHGQALVNTDAAGYKDKAGGIASGGALTLTAGTVDNTGGFIGAKKAFTADTRTFTNAAGGVVFGERAVAVDTQGAAYDNRAGKTEAAGDLTINAGEIDNAGGLIRSVAATTLDAGSVVNNNTSGKDQGIEGRNVAITVGSLRNTEGLISARNVLAIEANTFSGDGRLTSAKDLRIALIDDVVNTGEVSAQGSLSYTTAGAFTNKAKLASGGTTTVAGAQVDNTATGEISGALTVVDAENTLINRGLIDGGKTRLDASTLANVGTGRIYGDEISIAAGTLDNDAEMADGQTRSATIAARQRLDIGAKTINNRGGSLIFSAGDLHVGGALDAERRATGRAELLDNHASTIEALDSVYIDAQRLGNTNGGVNWRMVQGPVERVVEYAPPGSAERLKANDVLFAGGGYPFEVWPGFAATGAQDPYLPESAANTRLLVPSPDYPLARFGAYYAQSPGNSVDLSYQLCTGGDADNCETVRLPGAWYANDDPIWATFGVAPPPAGSDSGDPLYAQAHADLDQATRAFIRTMAGGRDGPFGIAIPSRMSSTWDFWDYTQTRSTPVLQTSAPARILSGKAMHIDVGAGANDMSQILAGGELVVTGGEVKNIDKVVDSETVRSGAVGHTFVKRHTFKDDDRRTELLPYDLTIATTTTLLAARQQGNTAIDGSGKHIDGLPAGPAGGGAPGSATVGNDRRVNPIVQVPAGGSDVVRTSDPNAGVPGASLFQTRSEPTSRYLVETDARFTDRHQWRSSDYLLNNLGMDPDHTLKRLGDGFYEQRLVREQVAQLTGFRLLRGFENDDAQYTALMNAGVTFAQQYGLRPGVALSAAQMAQLTSDIVWLVEQTVTLADGSTQRVLVPQVYVRVKEGDIDGSGAVLSGLDVDVQLDGDLANSGIVAGRRTVVIKAENVHNLHGRISGNALDVFARNDLHLSGGILDAASSLSAIALRDIDLATTTRSSASSGAGAHVGATVVDRVAGLYVSNPGGTLVARAGRDANLAGADLRSAGSVEVTALRDIRLDPVATGAIEDIRWSRKNARQTASIQQTGTAIAAGGDITILARRDVIASAATLSAGEDTDAGSPATLRVEAKRNLALVPGFDQTQAETHHATRGINRTSLDASSQDGSLVRSTLSAGARGTVRLASGADMLLGAVDVHARHLEIDAKGRLLLPAVTTRSSESGQSSSSDIMFAGSDGIGHDTDTTHYSRFDVATLDIKRPGGPITAQVSERHDLDTLARQPGMAWVDQLRSNPRLAGSTTWERVQEAHDKWEYHQSGLSATGAAIVSLVVGAMTMGAGTAAVGAAAVPAAGGAAGVAGTGMAGALGLSAAGTTVAAGAVQAGITAIASQATVSLINNQGNLAVVLEELGSSQSIRNIATAMVTAGAVQGLSTSGLLPQNLASATNGSARFADQLQRQLIDGTATALVRSAVNGTRLEDELRESIAAALLNTVAAQGAFAIGESGPQGSRALNAFAAEAAHAMAGCAIGAARAGSGDGCAPGAVGAVVGHLAAQYVNPTGNPALAGETIAVSQVVSGIAGVMASGSVQGLNIAAGAGSNAVANNRMLHPEERATAQRLAAQSDGRYTAEQIEAQMRLMGNRAQGVHADTVAQWDVATQPGYNVDSGLPTRAVPGTTQVLEVPARADWEVQQYIVANTSTGGGVNGVPPWVPYTTSSGASPSVGLPTGVPTATCAIGDYNCAAGIRNTQPAGTLVPPETRLEIAVGAERLGRQAGVVGAVATAVAATPGPHQVAAAATAIGATAVNLGATTVEQLFRPDPGKALVDAAVTGIGIAAEHVPGIGPVLAPVTNEMLEAWKNSGTSQPFQQWWNERFRHQPAN